MSDFTPPNIEPQPPTTDSGPTSPVTTQSFLFTGDNSDSEANIETVPNSPISTADGIDPPTTPSPPSESSGEAISGSLNESNSNKKTLKMTLNCQF